MRSIIFLVLAFLSVSHAHDGHGDHNEPGAIENGKLVSRDNLTYLDAGAKVQWLGQQLKRKVTEANEIVYQYTGEQKDLSVLSSSPDKYLDLKVTGGEVLKAFNFDHAGETHDMIEMTSPDLTQDVMVSRGTDLKLAWKADATASMIKVIIEMYSEAGQLTGRLTVSTNDDGEFNVPSQYLNQLPSGPGKIAVKRIWLGEFKPTEESKEIIGVKSVVSVVGTIKIAN